MHHFIKTLLIVPNQTQFRQHLVRFNPQFTLNLNFPRNITYKSFALPEDDNIIIIEVRWCWYINQTHSHNLTSEWHASRKGVAYVSPTHHRLSVIKNKQTEILL